MRPQTATIPKPNNHVLFNQLSGNYFVLSEEGKEIKVNKRGDIATKFINDFTGCFNFKQRKHRAMKDRALMYTQPVIDYDKENSFVCPMGNKFAGYAQSPYSLTGQIPQFLKQGTFKESLQAKNSENQAKKQYSVSTVSSICASMNEERTLNKFQSLKQFRTEISNCLNLGMIKEKVSEESIGGFLQKRHKKTEYKPQKSIIIKAGQNYASPHFHKRVKSMNMSTNATLSRESSPYKSIHKTTYFEQSLSNIERAQNPNYLQSNLSFLEFSANTFNQTSIKKSCYKNSCHNLQHVPKRRYFKTKKEQQMVNLNEHKITLKVEESEKKLVNRLKEQLKIYQPIVKQPQIKVEDAKKKADQAKKKSQTTAAKK